MKASVKTEAFFVSDLAKPEEQTEQSYCRVHGPPCFGVGASHSDACENEYVAPCFNHAHDGLPCVCRDAFMLKGPQRFWLLLSLHRGPVGGLELFLAFGAIEGVVGVFFSAFGACDHAVYIACRLGKVK